MAVSIKPRWLALLLHLSVPFLLLGVAAAFRRGPLIRWVPVDPNSLRVQDIGKFYVQEHNRLSGDHLLFRTVSCGSSLVKAGMNYNLTVSAAGGAWTYYEAVVRERAWLKSRNLTSFNPLD